VTRLHLKSLEHSTHGELLRYAILLDSFDYTIEHTKGKTHSLPDALSRRPFSAQKAQEAESSALELDPLYLNAITDDYFKKIPSTIETQMKSRSRHYRRHAQILTFTPIEMQDIVEPSVTAGQETNNRETDQQQPQAPPQQW
jgi:hypothetical protein